MHGLLTYLIDKKQKEVIISIVVQPVFLTKEVGTSWENMEEVARR
jgi:hypothetical protein